MKLPGMDGNWPKDVQAESDFQKALELAENDEEQRPVFQPSTEKNL